MQYRLIDHKTKPYSQKFLQSIYVLTNREKDFMKDSMSALIERNATDLNYLFNKNEVEKLFEDILKCSTDKELHCSIENFLVNHLRNETVDRRILAAHGFISEGNIRKVEELSSMLNISSTGLRNLFREKVGISPKDLIKIFRIKKALNFKFSGEESLTNLAYDLDYYDQAHFIHDFKDAVGLSPKQYFANEKLTFDFYNYGRWSYSNFTGKSS